MASKTKAATGASQRSAGNQMFLPESRKQYIRETDSDYTKLAKRGGHPDLLRIRTPPSRAEKQAVPYKKVDWFYQDDVKQERNAEQLQQQQGKPNASAARYDKDNSPSYDDRTEFQYGGDDYSSEFAPQDYPDMHAVRDYYPQEPISHEKRPEGKRHQNNDSRVDWYYDEGEGQGRAVRNASPSNENNYRYTPSDPFNRPEAKESRKASGQYYPQERTAPFAQEQENIFQSEGSQATNKTIKIEEPKKQGFGVRKDRNPQGPPDVPYDDGVSDCLSPPPNPAIERRQAIQAQRAEDAVNMTRLLSFGYTAQHGEAAVAKPALKERNGGNSHVVNDGPAYEDQGRRRRSAQLVNSNAGDIGHKTEYQANMEKVDISSLRLKDEYIARKMKAQDTANAARGAGILSFGSGPAGDTYVPSSYSYGGAVSTNAGPPRSDQRPPSSQQARRGRRVPSGLMPTMPASGGGRV